MVAPPRRRPWNEYISVFRPRALIERFRHCVDRQYFKFPQRWREDEKWLVCWRIVAWYRCNHFIICTNRAQTMSLYFRQWDQFVFVAALRRLGPLQNNNYSRFVRNDVTATCVAGGVKGYAWLDCRIIHRNYTVWRISILGRKYPGNHTGYTFHAIYLVLL